MFETLIFPPLTILILAMLVMLVASVVQAVLGMGYGLTASPLLLLLDPMFVPASTIMLGMLSSGLGASREYRQIVWPEVTFATVARLLGLVVALLLLSRMEAGGAFRLLFGTCLAIAVAMSLSGYVVPFNRIWLGIMGGVSGLMGTITGVGAPPLALIYQQRDPSSARPTLAAFFCLGCGFSAAGLWLIGWLGVRELILVAILLPAMLLGTWVGRKIEVVKTDHYRRSLLLIAGFSAIVLIAQGLLEI